jgi:predicted bacteriocin transport accessory protein
MNGKKIKGDKFSSKEIIIGISIAIVVVGVALFAFLPGNKTTPTENQSSNSNTIIAQSYADAKSSIEQNKENAVMVIGHDGCVYCVQTKPVISEFVKNKNAKFYYVDSTNTENINKLRADGVNIEGTPATIFYKKGQVVNNSAVPDQLENSSSKDANSPFVFVGQLNLKKLEEIVNAVKLIE